MKHPLFSAILLSAALTACRNNEQFSVSGLAASLELKRGNIISCGPPGAQYGSLQFEIDGSSHIQELFTMGVKMLHSFEYDEAEKIFATIIDKEPQTAMAYWGVAMSNFHPLWTPPTETEFTKGFKALGIAKQLAVSSGKEAGYINALSTYFTKGEKENHRSRCLRFEQAMESLYREYPADKEAAIFYALSLTAAADPADKTYAKQKQAGELLNKLYPGQPDHPGIIHYVIHAYDIPELATLALPAARKYASIAPSSAHALHMPSHIFTRLGLWDEAISSNLASVESAKCYAEQAGIKGHWDEEMHGLDYLVYAYLQKGDNNAARKYLDYVKTINRVEPMNFKVSYAFAAIPARYVLENKSWQEAAYIDIHLKNFDWSNHQWQKAIIHFTRVMGRVHTGNEKGAASELQQLQQIHDKLLQQGDGYKAQQVLIQLKSATAWLHLLQKKTDALALMMEAAELEDKTEKHPVTPGEILPAKQQLADMLMQLGKYEEAFAAYEADEQKHPNRFNTLYGAAVAADRLNKKDKARQYYQQLVNVSVVGSSREELKEARRWLQ
jgi:tetratricopeptide (TPR) repeat protein